MTGNVSLGIYFYKGFAVNIKDARFEVLTTVVLDFKAFWHTSLCLELLDAADEGSLSPQNA
jgi:hypothetical protein